MYRETKSRSLAKAITNRLINSLATFFLVLLFFPDEAPVAASIAMIEVVVKFILYYLNERMWDKIKLGKREIQPFVIWLTGLPYSGKSLIANAIYESLNKKGFTLERLDGVDVRTLFPIEGFTREERDAYLMRMGYFARLLKKNGVFVIASFISPYEKSRAYNRQLIKEYIEIYVSTPQEVCEEWDEWGTYERARKGEIDHFVGVQEPYEVPENPEIVVDLSQEKLDTAVSRILKTLPIKLN